MSDRSNSKPSIRTTIAQAGHFIDRETGAVIPAIQPSTTFARKEDYSLVGDYIYARNGSPTVAHAEGLLCELEEGFETRLFASGMGAASALIETVEFGPAHCRAHHYVSRREILDAAPADHAQCRP